MREGKIPFQKILFVCTNERAGKSACGNAERGEHCGVLLHKKLKEEIKKRGLKGKVRASRSGCMDVCGAGPNIMVFSGKGESIYYSHVTQENLSEIMEKHIKDDSSIA